MQVFHIIMHIAINAIGSMKITEIEGVGKEKSGNTS
jgi:hypothetical protein